MNRYTYKPQIFQKIGNCFVTDCFDHLPKALESLKIENKRVLLIHEKRYGGIYLKQIEEILTEIAKSCDSIDLNEKVTDFNLLAAQVQEKATKIGMEKDDLVISIGGWIADSAAKVFIEEYLPESHYLKIPMTLIGQVLSTERGDSQVNMNLYDAPDIVVTMNAVSGDVPAMVQRVNPDLVYINIEAYKYLEETERICGLGEILRASAGGDASLFQYMESYPGKKADNILDFLLNSIMNTLQVNKKGAEKGAIKTKYGYPVALGIEKCTNYIIPHGQAVGIGMVVANNISSKRGLLKESETFRLAKVMVSYGLSVVMNFTNDLIDAICQAMIDLNLVTEDGRFEEFELIDKIGRRIVVNDVTLDEIRSAMFYRK